MLCGVRYCGGCNPRYNRGGAFRKIKKHFAGRIDFQHAEEDVDYDLLLVISGCPNNCASTEHYKSKKGIVSIREEGQINTAIEELEKFLKE